MFIIILHIQRFQMRKHIIPDFTLHPARRAKNKVAPQKTSYRKCQPNHQDDNDILKDSAHIEGTRCKSVRNDSCYLGDVQIGKIQYE